MSATPSAPGEPHGARDADAAEDARDRRLYRLVLAWGVVTLGLLWLFERAFGV